MGHIVSTSAMGPKQQRHEGLPRNYNMGLTETEAEHNAARTDCGQ